MGIGRTTVTRYVGSPLARAIKRRLSGGDPNHLVAIDSLLRASRALPGDDPLMPTVDRARSKGSSLRHQVLREILRDVELGVWTIGSRTINFLQQVIEEDRPRLAIEMGAGISTLCLSRFMRDLHGPGRHVVSLEQDPKHATNTRHLLAEHGLAETAEILDVTLQERKFFGTPCKAYEVAELRDVLGDRRADLLLIDGPAGPSGVRVGTLPSALPLLAPGARFYLDDALREPDLAFARHWEGLDGVMIEGVMIMETGLLCGRITGP